MILVIALSFYIQILYLIHHLINATAAWTIAPIVVIEPIEDLCVVPCNHVFEFTVLLLHNKLCHDDLFVRWEELRIWNEWFTASGFKHFINWMKKNCLHAKSVRNESYSLWRIYQNRYKCYRPRCNKFYTPKMANCACWRCSGCGKWWTTKQDWAKDLQMFKFVCNPKVETTHQG